jgi:hypothetical protein
MDQQQVNPVNPHVNPVTSNRLSSDYTAMIDPLASDYHHPVVKSDYHSANPDYHSANPDYHHPANPDLISSDLVSEDCILTDVDAFIAQESHEIKSETDQWDLF